MKCLSSKNGMYENTNLVHTYIHDRADFLWVWLILLSRWLRVQPTFLTLNLSQSTLTPAWHNARSIVVCSRTEMNISPAGESSNDS